MLNPIETAFTSGVTLYAVIHSPAGTVWNNTTSAWVAYAGGSWADYAVPLTEQGASGYYSAAFPAGAAGAILPSEVLYQQAGGTPATTDAPATGVGQSQGVDVASISASVVAAINLSLSALSMKQGAVAATPASTALKIYTNLTDTVNAYGGRLLIFTSGVLIRQVANIVSFTPTGAYLTLAGALTAAPAVADTFIIV